MHSLNNVFFSIHFYPGLLLKSVVIYASKILSLEVKLDFPILPLFFVKIVGRVCSDISLICFFQFFFFRIPYACNLFFIFSGFFRYFFTDWQWSFCFILPNKRDIISIYFLFAPNFVVNSQIFFWVGRLPNYVMCLIDFLKQFWFFSLFFLFRQDFVVQEGTCGTAPFFVDVFWEV